jgi:Flp pilus assembly protein TadG
MGIYVKEQIAPSLCANTEAPPTGEWQRTRLSSGEEGQSLIEFALCLPVLFLLMTGIFAFGITIGNYVTLTNGTNAAAMQLGISRGQTLDPCAIVSAAVYAAAPSLKQSSLTFAYVLNGTSYSGTTCSSASTTTGAAGNLVQGKTAQVTVTYPCSLKLYNANYFPNCVLTSKTTELVQ